MKFFFTILLSGIIYAIPTWAENWSKVDQYIPVRQKAFCNLMDKYEVKAQEAASSRNQIRQNRVSLDRGQDLLALMPDGSFASWLVQVEEVFVVANGDAAYDLRLQCGVSLGSGKLDGGEAYMATAPEGSVIYNQLADVGVGDFILVNGQLVKFKELNASDRGPAFATQLSGDQARGYKRYNERVKYFADINTLAKFNLN